jgi:hypothetical protein
LVSKAKEGRTIAPFYSKIIKEAKLKKHPFSKEKWQLYSKLIRFNKFTTKTRLSSQINSVQLAKYLLSNYYY